MGTFILCIFFRSWNQPSSLTVSMVYWGGLLLPDPAWSVLVTAFGPGRIIFYMFRSDSTIPNWYQNFNGSLLFKPLFIIVENAISGEKVMSDDECSEDWFNEDDSQIRFPAFIDLVLCFLMEEHFDRVLQSRLVESFHWICACQVPNSSLVVLR